MLQQQAIQPYMRILKRYKIIPDYVEDFGKIKKVYTKNGIFALKQVQFNEEQRTQFMNTIQSLHGKGYRHVIPIYQTIKGNYLIRYNHKEYYVMPWIENNQARYEDSYGDILKEAARLHALTEVKGPANQSNFQHFFDKSKIKIDKRKLDYERFIEKCERKIYMSPFELLFCTYFMQLIRMEDEALRHLENWFEAVKEKKQDRVAICHGNLSPGHLLYDESGHSYLINFERTYTASPIYDLHDFFKKLFYHYPQKAKLGPNLYMQYNRNNHLMEDEKLLLFYYLTQTENINQIIQRYQSHSSLSERKMTATLQRSIWKMQAAQTLVSQVNEATQQEYNTTNDTESEAVAKAEENGQGPMEQA